jgi:hypothetical protein
MDLFYLGDCLRGLNLNPTLKMIDKLGGTKKKGEKYLKLEEVNQRVCWIYNIDLEKNNKNRENLRFCFYSLIEGIRPEFFSGGNQEHRLCFYLKYSSMWIGMF